MVWYGLNGSEFNTMNDKGRYRAARAAKNQNVCKTILSWYMAGLVAGKREQKNAILSTDMTWWRCFDVQCPCNNQRLCVHQVATMCAYVEVLCVCFMRTFR